MSSEIQTTVTIPTRGISIDILMSNNKLRVKDILKKMQYLDTAIRVFACKKKGILYILEEDILERIDCKKELSKSEITKILQKKYAQENITEKLIKHKATISTMESCTSGLIASTITDTEGASEILKGSSITYSNECKILEGVPKKIIDKYGVYSKETALYMAKAAKKKYKSKFSIGVTGSAGRVDPNNKDSVSGVIFYCINGKDNCMGKIIFLDCSYTRKQFKEIITEKILSQLNTMI